MNSGYWSSILTKRQLVRRRFLAGATGLAASAAALSLIGCGGSNSGDSGKVKGDASGLLTSAEDTTKQGKPGGTWQSSYVEDVVNMDPIINNASPTYPQLLPVYSQLLKGGVNIAHKPGADAISGDAAESWEFNGDGTQITLKLRPNMKWDPRPPTNGRVMTSADVKWSWDKFATVGNSAAVLVNARADDAPITSIQVPDDRTVVFKMAYPYPNIIDELSNYQNFYVMPQDDTFNFKTDMRGNGPYRLEEFRPSSHANYVRNPDWYDSPRPYFDRIERTLISEYASGLAQFEAKNIYDFTTIRGEDVLATKRKHPEMVMLPDLNITGSLGGFLNFSKRPDGLFNDVRVRRAASMMLDRDLFIETFENVKEFKDAGLPVEIYWSGFLGPGLPEWLDPKTTAVGEGQKYYQHNIAEAKKLVDAAGVKQPYAAPFGHYIDQVPADQPRFQVMIQMMNEGGIFNFTSDPLLYNTSWRSARQAGGMEHLGVLWHRTADLSADVILTQMWTPKGRNAVDSRGPTPGITDLVAKQKSELDPAKRKAIVQDIQRQLSLDWPVIPAPGTAGGFTLRWPWLENWNTFIQGNTTAKSFVYAWYNAAKKTS